MPDISFIEVETQANPSTAIIWLHGLGADSSDFVPIVQALGLADCAGIRFIFPDAPHRPVTCNGGYVMRAWYDIISLAPNNREIDEQGLVESMSIVRQLISREEDRGIPSHQIFLAGFSQGGAVAYTTALTHPAPLGGVLALSTYIPSARLVSEHLSASNRHIPIFAAHGIADTVVSITLGEQAVALLRSHGYAPDWHTYDMAHEVSPEEINTISDWLRGKVPQCAASLGRQAEGDTNTLNAPPQNPKIVLQPYSTVPAYVTKDGSEIREMMHPGVHGNAAQSLAEATVPPGTQTHRHRHLKTEEIYHVILNPCANIIKNQ